MPTKTKPRPPTPSPLPDRGALAARVLAAAAGAATLELLAGLFLGAFPLTERADAFAFLLFRPWAVLLIALLVARLGWRWRVAAYLAFLLLAGVGEASYMHRLGNPDPWPEMLRGWVTGAGVALVAEAVLAVARRGGRRWTVAAGLLLAAAFALPPVRGAYERALAAPLPPLAAAKPEVLLMTALPLIWGEGGAFDPASRPAASYTALQPEFTLRPIDVLQPASLGKARLLLLVQPRWLSPEELVALDAWIRAGGRALILADPRLTWHGELPLGDIRRAPPATLLRPLLDHWGLALELREGNHAEVVARGRLLRLENPGTLTPAAGACTVKRSFLARCRIGRGQAIVLADADLLRDDLWRGDGATGESRQRRTSDNPLVIADLLDELAALDRPRALGDARWRTAGCTPLGALLPTLLPLLALLLGAGGFALLRRRAR